MAMIQNRRTPSGGGSGVLMEVTGIPELDRKFNALDRKMRRSIGTKALRRAAKAELGYVKMMAPVDTGYLKKSFSVMSMNLSYRARKAGIFGVKVALRKNRREVAGRYAGVIEKGTRDGSKKGTYFMKRSAYLGKDMVKDIFVNEMKSLMDEAGGG